MIVKLLIKNFEHIILFLKNKILYLILYIFLLINYKNYMKKKFNYQIYKDKEKELEEKNLQKLQI